MNFHKNASKQQKGIVQQYVAHFEEKNFFFKYLSPFTGLIKNCCLNKYKFSFENAPIKHGKKNKFLEYFSARFGKSHLI